MTGTGVTVVVKLLLDVHHVAAGVLELPQLCTSAQVSQVTELREP